MRSKSGYGHFSPAKLTYPGESDISTYYVHMDEIEKNNISPSRKFTGSSNTGARWALWGTVRNGYRERPTLKMTPPTIVQNFGILEEFWRRKQGFISNWLRILSKSIWRGGKMGRGKWYLDTSDKNCCYMGCIRPRHKRFSSAVSSDT